MILKRTYSALALCTLMACSGLAIAVVTADEAAKLKTTLTPLGGEKAGNKDGSIPAWSGGYTTVPAGYKTGQTRSDPFASEKPLFKISAANADEYGDRVAEGVKAMLKLMPGYRIDVYPSHRTAAAPQWVYDNTFKNATNAKTKNAGLFLEGAYGGIPFPIPKDGIEAMWNHVLAWKGEGNSGRVVTYIGSGGKLLLANAANFIQQYPYYNKNGSVQSFKGEYYWVRHTTTDPAFKAGENLLIRDSVDQLGEGRKAWQYLVGQRRVRKSPSVAYDTPSSIASGFYNFDETFMFNGAMDRYDWKLVGKKEVYVPYNANAFHAATVTKALLPEYANPDYLRWELHRVWVVEATLVPGKRHAMKKRRFYLDEDTWNILLAESWDANGQLWHVSQALPILAPDFPCLALQAHLHYDLLKKGYAGSSLFNEVGEGLSFANMALKPEDEFTPDALARTGVR